MSINRLKIALHTHTTYLTVMLFILCTSVFAQKIDTNVINYKPKAKAVSKVPVIKGSVQPYKPNIYRYIATNNSGSLNAESHKERTLTILKIYPNPVVEQLNINLRLEKETTLSIKITDLLGNDVVTLANERTAAGEHTKTYNVPSKLNTGIYFLRIVAGGEPVIKRISVL